MIDWTGLAVYFLATVVLQNLVLSTGFGVTALTRLLRGGKQAVRLWLFMTLFCLLTALTVYPFDRFIAADELRLWRPLIALAATAFWYIAVVLLLKKLAPTTYARVQRVLPLGAFNGVVVSVSLLANFRVSVELPGLLVLCVGASLSFLVLSLILAYGVRRTDHSDLPEAFRGLPITLLYLGLLALALLGFSSPVSFL